MQFCNCMGVRALNDAWNDIWDEMKEVVEVESIAELKDELSDVMWGIGRLLAGVVGRVYVRMPGDRLHYVKVMARMEEYGCVRSRRKLVAGRCASS